MDRMLQILTIGFPAVNTMRAVAYIDDLNERKANTLVHVIMFMIHLLKIIG